MTTLALEHLTVAGVEAPELITIAADTGCQTVSLIMESRNVSLGISPLVRRLQLVRETAARIDATGVTVTNIDGFALFENTEPRSFSKALEVGASLGARNAITLFFDSEPSRAFDRFCHLCEIATQFELDVLLEFTPLSNIAGIDDAVALLQRAAQPNAKLLVDSLHLYRSGTQDLLSGIDPALIGYAQICDGPLETTDEDYFYEALFERQIPGEGKLDLAGFVRQLPPGTIVGAEVPLKSLRDQGLTQAECARRVMDGTRGVLGMA